MRTIYALLPNLRNPATERVSGGMISNIHLLAGMAGTERVVVIPMLAKGGIPAELDRPGIRIEMPATAMHGRAGYFLQRYLFFERRARRLIGQYGEGRIVATRGTIPIALRISRTTGYPLDIIVRAYEDLEQAGLRGPSDTRTLYRRLEGRLSRPSIMQAYRSADRVIVNSEYLGAETKRGFGTDAEIRVVYPEIGLTAANPVDTGITTIGFINKGSRKGADLVLELAQSLPGMTFRVFGDPLPAREGIRNVENEGYMNDRVKLFDSADLFIMPSAWDEPYGRVAAECLWRGKPVLVSKRGGLPEAAPVAAFHVEDDTCEAWKRAIESLEASPTTAADAVLEAQKALSTQRTVL